MAVGLFVVVRGPTVFENYFNPVFAYLRLVNDTSLLFSNSSSLMELSCSEAFEDLRFIFLFVPLETYVAYFFLF